MEFCKNYSKSPGTKCCKWLCQNLTLHSLQVASPNASFGRKVIIRTYTPFVASFSKLLLSSKKTETAENGTLLTCGTIWGASIIQHYAATPYCKYFRLLSGGLLPCPNRTFADLDQQMQTRHLPKDICRFGIRHLPNRILNICKRIKISKIMASLNKLFMIS